MESTTFDSLKQTSFRAENNKKTDVKIVWHFSSKKGNENRALNKKAILSPLLTKFKPQYIQESLEESFDEEDDEVSVQFSVDPDMLQKLNLRKPRNGEEYTPNDNDKILQFQLDRDISRLIEVKGSYRERSGKFLSLRRKDPAYVKISRAPKVALNGDFRAIINRSIETSWRATSKPYGEIAHKRYLEYLANLPKGPTKAEIIAAQQKKIDTDLWENIKYGRTEMTLKQRREQHILEQEAQVANFVNENKVDIHRKERLRKAAIEQERYDLLRVLPTKNQFNESFIGWSRGTTYPYDFERNAYPQIQQEKEFRASASTGVVEEKHFGFGGPRNKSLRAKQKQQSTEKYMGERTIEKGFWQYISNIRLNSAVDSMSQSKVKQRRRQGVRNILEGVNVRAIQRHGMGIDARRANQSNWVLSNSFSLNFLRQSQYRAKVHPGMDREGSWNTNNDIGHPYRNNETYPANDALSERLARHHSLSSAEECLINVKRNIKRSKRYLQEEEKRLRPDPVKLFRGLVSKQRMNEYNMAKRRLKSLESQGVQVLALKQKDVEVAKAALASLGEDDDDEYFATGKPLASTESKGDALPIASYAVMRSEENQEKLHQLVQQRMDEKRRQQRMARLENKLLCRSEDQQRDVDGPKPTPDDLVLAATAGRYKEVIDMIHHRFYPIDVTEPNSDGLTATYAVLRLLLQDASPSTAGGDKEEIFGDLLGSTLQKWKKRLLQGVYRFIGIDYHRIRLLNQRKESMDLVLQLLVNNGGRVEDIHGDYDTDKLSLLHLAATSAALPMMQWLLDAGSDVNIRSEFGKTPLMCSVESDSVPMTVLLLRGGAMKEVDLTDRDGNTALHIAARKASVELAQLLLACDASLQLRNCEGLSALDVARKAGRTAMAVALSTFLPPQGEFRHRIAFMMQQYAAERINLDEEEESISEDDNGEQIVEAKVEQVED